MSRRRPAVLALVLLLGLSVQGLLIQPPFSAFAHAEYWVALMANWICAGVTPTMGARPSSCWLQEQPSSMKVLTAAQHSELGMGAEATAALMDSSSLAGLESRVFR